MVIDDPLSTTIFGFHKDDDLSSPVSDRDSVITSPRCTLHDRSVDVLVTEAVFSFLCILLISPLSSSHVIGVILSLVRGRVSISTIILAFLSIGLSMMTMGGTMILILGDG